MASGRRIRILIVDDSAVMRSLLRSVVSADSGLEVAGTAADGESALNSVETLRPDLMLLDVEMPVMDGLITLKKLRARGHKMPVIMCSSLTQRGARVTIEALASGASDYVAKPAGQASREAATHALSQDLLPKIQALTSAMQSPPQSSFPLGGPRGGATGPRVVAAGAGRLASLFPSAPPFRPQSVTNVPTVLAIGVSTGGPAALDIVLPALPANFPLPVLIVQHMPELFTKLFAERLNSRCRLRVVEGAEGDPVRPGVISIARGNWHMEVLPAARASFPPTLHLSQGPPRESLPARGGRALSQRCRSLWFGCVGRGAHRHGLRRHRQLPHHSRSGRRCPGPGSGHKCRLGNARLGRQRGARPSGASPQRRRS